MGFMKVARHCTAVILTRRNGVRPNAGNNYAVRPQINVAGAPGANNVRVIRARLTAPVYSQHMDGICRVRLEMNCSFMVAGRCVALCT